MRPAASSILAVAAALLLAAPVIAAPAIIPRPLSERALQGPPVLIGQGTPILVPAGDPQALGVARYVSALVFRSRGLALRVEIGARAPRRGAFIVLRRGAAGGAEGYLLDIAGRRVAITAPARAGLFYGAASLWQIMTDDPGRGVARLAPLHIDDAPRFSWRGLLLDSARHFQSPAQVEKLIDWMALHKLDVLQWHLTDDQGWRLEVPAYPRLTTIGAWRVPAFVGAPPIDPRTGAPALYGGFYTRAQVRRIVAFAAARNVAIVPEIETPGHVVAALLAYPQLSAGPPPPASIASDWGIFPYALGLDQPVFDFLSTVLDEVMDLFPSRYIAVGGDEVVSAAWTDSPRVAARMRALGLADAGAARAWFNARVAQILAVRGRTPIAWDEVLQEGGAPPGFAIEAWRGGAAASGAAALGHDVVLAVSPTLYFDHRQSDLVGEPPGRGDVVSLADVYRFDPPPPPTAAPGVAPGKILGLQGALWSEHIASFPDLEAMAFPRAAALAELAWSGGDGRDWRDFLSRLPAEFARFAAIGLAEDKSAFAVKPNLQPQGASAVRVVLSSQTGYGAIRYGESGAVSRVYDAPLTLALPTRLTAASFAGGARVSPILAEKLDPLSVRRKVSQELRSCTDKVTLDLQGAAAPSGVRPVYLVDVMNPCWIWPDADLDGIEAISVGVGRLPFNFQIGADKAKIVLRAPATPDGELEIRLDGCEKPALAVLPLAAAAARAAQTTLSAAISPLAGRHDLCFVFTGRRLDPMWVLGFVQLEPGAAPGAPG